MGDPHGDFGRVRDLAIQRRPAAIVFLGDLELPAPFEEVFDPILRAKKTRLFAIHGNHDADESDLWSRMHDGPLTEDFNIHGRLVDVDGVRIAGLGGLFRSRIWSPIGEPCWRSYDEFERHGFGDTHGRASSAFSENYKRSELLTHRASIFPDVYERVAKFSADVLVTHEAPHILHSLGHPGITQLAARMQVPLAFCGHHHESKEVWRQPGSRWRMVDAGQVVDLNGDDVS